MRIAGLLLAAGAGSRFGSQKQLALFDGKPMVRHCLENLAPLFGERLFIVLGANHEEIEPLVNDLSKVIEHPHWRNGLGSSIAHGVAEIEKQGSYDGVLIALADQVRLTEPDFSRLINRFDGSQIVAASYADKPGAPAIFPTNLFDQLKCLDGDRGAKFLLKNLAQELVSVPLPMAAIDIDRPEDIELLKSRVMRCAK